MGILNHSFVNDRLGVSLNWVLSVLALEDNLIEIGLIDSSPAAIKEFKREIMDAPFLKFCQTSGIDATPEVIEVQEKETE